MRTKPLPNIEGDANLIRTAKALCDGANNHKIISATSHLELLHALVRDEEGSRPVSDDDIDYVNKTLPKVRKEIIDICANYGRILP